MRTGLITALAIRQFRRIHSASAHFYIILMLTLIPPFAAQTPGLVAYYPLNGDGQDASGNGLNGTVTGAVATSDRYGNGSGALLFVNDTDRVNCGNPAAFNFSGPFTISAWVNLNGT